MTTPLAFGLGVRHGHLSADVMYNDTALLNGGLQGEGLFVGEEPGLAAATVGWRFWVRSTDRARPAEPHPTTGRCTTPCSC